MEIKVNCPCGQSYAFDVEPVHNAMPCGVNCPGCGADGTQLANDFLARAASPKAAEPVARGLRINRPASVAAPVPETASAGTSGPETASSPPRRFYTRALEPEKPAPPASQENVPMGILGGVIAGAICMLIWYGLTMATGRSFGIVAWFMGAVVGIGVRILGKDGSALMGLIASMCAAVAILGGQFLVVNVVVNKVIVKMAKSAYDAKMESAKHGVNAKSDEEIKTWFASDDDHEGEVTSAEIRTFRDQRQPKMQQFIDGNPSRNQFETDFRTRLSSMGLKYAIFKESISLFTVLFVCFGIASAYRIGAA